MTLPRPLATDGRVDHDPDTQTLIVRPAANADGYAKLLWREGHAEMVKAEERYGGPSVWADGGGKHQIARGHPGAAGTLRFTFAPGDPAYKELARTPDLADYRGRPRRSHPERPLPQPRDVSAVAMHRRIPTTDRLPTLELLTFNPDDWPGPAHETTWYPAFERWCAARSAWEDQHPGWLGNPIERLHDEYQTRHRLMQAWPLEPMGPVAIHDYIVCEGVYDPVTGLLRGRVSGEEHIPAGGTGTRHCDWLPGF